jgi:hypothetical protein
LLRLSATGLLPTQTAFDHWHPDETDQGRLYRFVDAERLIADFFDEIARIIGQGEP